MRRVKRFVSLTLAILVLIMGTVDNVEARDYKDDAEQRKLDDIQSNSIKNWPQGPAIGADGAVLMDADTGAVLYAKNPDKELYPASVTKIMTGLLAVENKELDEVITFSKEAVYSVPWDGCQMGMSVGEEITLEQCLNGVLVHSANEAANGVAEFIGGSIAGFADMMNKRAWELGCRHTHFSNPSGLFAEDHYTSARDLALIMKEFVKYDVLCKMASQHSYTVDSTNMRSEGFTVYSKNKFFNGTYDYDKVICSKTGYTGEARQTLVSCAERDGRRLVCVILREESPAQFEDTIQLFDYGFDNFENVEVKSTQDAYKLTSANFFDIRKLYNLKLTDDSARVTIPKGTKLSKLKVSYQAQQELSNTKVNKNKLVVQSPDNEAVLEMNSELDGIAELVYSYNTVEVGRVSVKSMGVKPKASEKEESWVDTAGHAVVRSASGVTKIIVVVLAIGMLAVIGLVWWRKKSKR